MPRMIRKQIYLEPEHNRLLKELADQQRISEAQVIRRALEQQTSAPRPSGPDLLAWRAELDFIRERSRQFSRGRRKRRQWKREDLYQDRLSRYARNRNR